ncbi:MAG: 30S ribosome-binding factor RbfA [Lachnospiraceae bacterium]|nr:30S ribosome-binding factor RbfA [Lachnospiraceae bacterium]MBR6303090.1 30S ribosome-binding factor RbfA [Lachnospiraceae bacterium]
MRKNSIKNTRVNGEVQKELSVIIRDEIKDPRISPWTSVVDVQVAPDLKTCKVWISVLGSEEDRDNTAKGLKSAAPYIRRELAHRLNLRNTPEINFVMDQSIEYGVNMTHKIDEVIAKDESAAKERGDESEEDTSEEQV